MSRTATAPVKTVAGKLLVNEQGMTLYVFSLDKNGKSVCVGKCAQLWPPLLLPKGADVHATVAGITGKFGVTIRAGGARQLTFDGVPLYTFSADKKTGQINGQGLKGIWWAVAVAPSSATSASSGSSSGGW